jgi:hypothetical protein
MWNKVDATQVAIDKERGEYDIPYPLFRRDNAVHSLDIDELLIYLNALEEAVDMYVEFGEYNPMVEILNDEPIETVKFVKALERRGQNNG